MGRRGETLGYGGPVRPAAASATRAQVPRRRQVGRCVVPFGPARAQPAVVPGAGTAAPPPFVGESRKSMLPGRALFAWDTLSLSPRPRWRSTVGLALACGVQDLKQLPALPAVICELA